MSTETTVLNELLDPVGHCLTPEVAKEIVALRASPEAQTRIEELAAKSTEGKLTNDERVAYETYISAGNFIAVLQSKARKLLQENNPS